MRSCGGSRDSPATCSTTTASMKATDCHPRESHFVGTHIMSCRRERDRASRRVLLVISGQRVCGFVKHHHLGVHRPPTRDATRSAARPRLRRIGAPLAGIPTRPQTPPRFGLGFAQRFTWIGAIMFSSTVMCGTDEVKDMRYLDGAVYVRFGIVDGRQDVHLRVDRLSLLMQRSIVLLPEPLGPITTTSRLPTTPEMPLSLPVPSAV